MNISVQKTALISAINQVLKAISSHTALPILSGIKLVANEKGIELTGSDSNISVISFIPRELNGDTLAEIQKDGSIVLQARFFSDIIKKLPKDDIEISVEDYVVKIISGKSKFQLNGLDSEEYPRLPVFDEENVFTIKANELRKIISETAFAVSNSETRPILTGVQWVVNPDRLICIATDSHRLARKKIAIQGLNEAATVVIPGKSLLELYKVLEDTENEVKVVLTDHQVIFHCDQLTFYTRLLEGHFPETSRLIPSEYKTELVMNVKDLSDALDRASVLASSNRVVKMDIQKDEMFIRLSARENEVGNANEDLLADFLEGDDLTISFSAKYLKDALKTMQGIVEIQFTGAMRPFVLREKGNTDLLQLLLPVRTY